MRRRIISSLTAVLALLALTAGPATAYDILEDRYFYTSAIDTDRDGRFDLSICYGVSTTDPIYVNRSALATGLAEWTKASPGAFTSNGICNNDGSNIIVDWLNLGPCTPDNLNIGLTQDISGGYSQIRVWFNTQCRDNDMYDWGGAISAGKVSAVSTLLHEVGHALRIGHSNSPWVGMSQGGPGHCSPTGQRFSLANDDLNAFRDAYPGIIDTATVIGNNSQCFD